MPEYELKEMSPDRLAEIAERWEEIAGVDEFAVELREVLRAASENLTHREGYGHVLELHQSITGEAHALLEIVDSPRQELTKLLKLSISPAYWPAGASESDVDALARVLTGAFLGMLQSGIEKGFSEVKLYGRSDLMLHVLIALADHWDFTEGSATMEGRWLRISLKEEGN